MRFVLALTAFASFAVGTAHANPSPITNEQFLDAAYKNCAEVDNRDVKSCDCERKLIGDRVIPEDKEMAFYYWADKPKFQTEFEKRAKADPKWQEGFAERMSQVGALITAACTVRRR